MNAAKEATLHTIFWGTLSLSIIFGGKALYESSKMAIPTIQGYKLSQKEVYQNIKEVVKPGLISYGLLIPAGLAGLGLLYKRKEHE